MNTQQSGVESGVAEYEDIPVPAEARQSLAAVSAVWLGFPMILTCAVFGGLIVYSLGFRMGLLAIVLGNLVLMAYVGALSWLAGRTGKSFALTAIATFGSRGYVVVAGFLASIVIGWFAFQTGLTGAILADTLGWSAPWTALGAGIGYLVITLFGIRALSVLGMITAPLYLADGTARRYRGDARGGGRLVAFRTVVEPARCRGAAHRHCHRAGSAGLRARQPAARSALGGVRGLGRRSARGAGRAPLRAAAVRCADRNAGGGGDLHDGRLAWSPPGGKGWRMSAFGQVAAFPYAWPFDGPVDPRQTAVLCIDWQVDFCGEGGYVDAMGYDLALTRAGLAPTARLLAAVRPGPPIARIILPPCRW